MGSPVAISARAKVRPPLPPSWRATRGGMPSRTIQFDEIGSEQGAEFREQGEEAHHRETARGHHQSCDLDHHVVMLFALVDGDMGASAPLTQAGPKAASTRSATAGDACFEFHSTNTE